MSGVPRKRKAWVAFGAALIEATISAGQTGEQRHHYTVNDRFLSSRGGRRWTFVNVDSFTANQRQRFVSDLLALVRSRAIIDLPNLIGKRWIS